jgi:hypothetical protein
MQLKQIDNEQSLNGAEMHRKQQQQNARSWQAVVNVSELFYSNLILCNLSIRIPVHLVFSTQIQSLCNLLLMHLVQVFQQHITVPLLALVLAHIVTPAAHCASQSSRYVSLLADFGDWMEIRPDGKHNATGSRKSNAESDVSRFVDCDKGSQQVLTVSDSAVHF